MKLQSSRRSGRALTSCLRYALAEGSRPSHLSRSFLRELRRLDPKLELHWISSINRWVLYRVASPGIIPGEDRLVKELEIKGPNGEFRVPGHWLIDWLRKHDKTRGGAVCPEYANRKFLKKIDSEVDVQDQLIAKKTWELTESKAHDIENFALRRRRSQILEKGTADVFKKSRKKRGGIH
jgi:hypothetical protein